METKERSEAAVGWTMFASTMMVLMGVWWAVAGFSGILKDDVFVVTKNYVFKLDTSSWGWIHLVLGIVILLAGAALYNGAVWARTVGVILSGISGILAFMWLPLYPFWALCIIAIVFFVVWALTVHGRDIVE